MPPVVEGKQAEVQLGKRERMLVELLGEEHNILLPVGMAQEKAEEDNDVNDLLRKLEVVVHSMRVALRLHMDSPRDCLLSAMEIGCKKNHSNSNFISH